MSPNAVTIMENLGSEPKAFSISTSLRPGDRVLYLPSDAPTPDELASFTPAGRIEEAVRRAKQRRDDAYDELRAAQAALDAARLTAREVSR